MIEERYLSEVGPAGLFTRLTRVGLLLDLFQHRCLDRFGLLFIDYSLLRVLHLAGKPYRMSPTELSDVLLRSSGGVTQILDRLESGSLIERSSDPADRRRVLVGLTDKGVRVARQAGAAYKAERDRILADLSDAEVRRIDASVTRLLEVLTAEASEVR